MNQQALAYRPDIDGLRAVAVLAVVFHHFAPGVMPGGFIGVDVFFVISGFLITRQLLNRDLDEGLKLGDFYRRRIHRIFPALWVVVMVSLLVGAVVMTPADWVMVARSAISAVFGWSNIFFWREYGNYFAGNVAEAPLLHTWSLGVEEQFYMLWPVMLWLALKLPKRWVDVLLIVVISIAVIFSEWAVGRFASASYYLLPTRFFELMVGCGVAWMAWRQWVTNIKKIEATIIGVFGFALLALSLMWLNPLSIFPGWRALLPCLATAFLLIAGIREYSGRKFLTHPWVVHLGLISYSLYLWHWPIVAWAHYKGIELSPFLLLCAVSVSLVLAELSWRWVELPWRKLGHSSNLRKTFFVYTAPAVIVFITVSWGVIHLQGLPSRFDERVAKFEMALMQRPEQLRAGCHVPSALYAQLPDPSNCLLGNVVESPVGVLWGDSYANHFSGMVDVMARQQGVSLMDYTMDACPPLLNYRPVGNDLYAKRCVERNAQIFNFLRSSNLTRVVLAANWPTDEEAGIRFGETLEQLLGMGLRVTVIHRNQFMPKGPGCAVREAMQGKTGGCATPEDLQPRYLSDMSSMFKGVVELKPNQLICTGGSCDVLRNGILLYRDGGHLNDLGSRELGREFSGLGYSL